MMVPVTCKGSNCNNAFKVQACQLKRGRGKFCSRKCKGMGFDVTGANNNRWAGGRTIHESGYILLKSPDHPRATKAGYVREHRLVMEKKLGRYLIPSEDVDHINGIKTDNRPENLQVVSRTEHLKIEHKRGVYTKHLLELNQGVVA